MIYLFDVMDPEEAVSLATKLNHMDGWVDGKATAGEGVKDRKDNEQLIIRQPADDYSPVETCAGAMMVDKLTSALGPYSLMAPRFSRYKPTGQHYGWHVDSALLPNQARNDVSMSLMLRPAIEGGTIQIKVGGVHMSFDLKAGQVLVWAGHLEHQVLPVTEGTRTVAIGFATCAIADPIAREIIMRQARIAQTAELNEQQRSDSAFALTNNHRLWLRPFT